MLGCMYLFGLEFSSLLDICLVVVAPIYIPPTMQSSSLFSTPSVAFIICRHFDDSHSDWCEVIPHCNFYLHFSIKIPSIFSCTFWSFICLHWRNIYLGVLPISLIFLFFILSYKSCLYILEINPLKLLLFSSLVFFFP